MSNRKQSVSIINTWNFIQQIVKARVGVTFLHTKNVLKETVTNIAINCEAYNKT